MKQERSPLDYCRSCRRETRWNRSGSVNGTRPYVLYWRCSSCSSERVQLGQGSGSVADVARLAEMVVNERRRGAEQDVESARLDFEDAEGHIREAIYSAYVSWDPARNPRLISYVTWKARLALTNWFRDELGQFTPKALAWAISSEALESSDYADETEQDVMGKVVLVEAIPAMAEGSFTHALVAIEDEEIRATLREVVLPIALGYSHAEVAVFHGQSEAWVSAKLRKLRLREDLRVPA
ncbi:MAG: hypothetical protein H0U46_04885 [Actinobacteria bacterium]|nr:hypothetical protein [Actinomycetota bacterium]